MKCFEVRLAATVRDVSPGACEFDSQDDLESPPRPRESALVVRVDMGDDAGPEDAVRELARRLERLCETPEYEGG